MDVCSDAEGSGKLDIAAGAMTRTPEKPRSAPSSIAGGADCQSDKPKWITSKTNTLKEIEAWATNGRQNEASDFARHSGQLMDNVTEQRMLQCKLWELSKERHKFLSQNDYEKKIFLDRQQRKSAALKEMLDGVTPEGTRASWNKEAMKRRLNTPVSRSRSSARSALLDRVDPKNRRDRPRELQAKDVDSRQSSCPTPSESSRRSQGTLPHVAPSVSSQDTNTERNPRTRANLALLFPTEPTLPVQKPPPPRPKTSFDRVTNSELFVGDHPPTTVRFADSAADQPTSPRTWTTFQWNRASTLSAKSRTTTTTEREIVVPSLDARYAKLTRSLSDNYSHVCPNNGSNTIAGIVSRIEALHMPSKRPKDSKPRVTHKIKQFMRERGIQF